MAYLKSLPLPPMGVAFGQILPAIGVFTILQLIALSIFALALGVGLPFPAPMLLLLLPFNWLSMALDNLLFLWFPYRFAPKDAGSFQFMGRTMLVAWPCWSTGGESLWLAGAGAGLVLIGEALGATYMLGETFRGLDLTKDVPG